MGEYRNKELERLLEKAEKLDWTYILYKEDDGRTYAEMEKYSPLGEDFCMTIDFNEESPVDTFMDEMKEYYSDFDPEEHAEMWIENRGKNGTPSSIQDLLDDAKDIEDMIGELIQYLEGMEDKRKVLITSGMSHDAILFVTDAPTNEIEKWCKHYVKELENGENTYLHILKSEYYINILFDSEENEEWDDIEVIGYDEVFDLFDY